MNTLLKGITGAALLGASSLALAVPLTGGISVSSLAGSDFTYDTTANTFDFDDDIPNGAINAVSGDFADYFVVKDEVTMYDFSYDPIATPKMMWSGEATVGANSGTELSFILEQGGVEYEGSNSVIISGIGYLTDGETNVTGEWRITAQDAAGTFSWSSSTSVPEPGTLALLGLGLAGLGAVRRRQKA